MSKTKKVALIVVGVIVVAIAALAIIIPMVFDVDRYRPQVAAEIQQETGKTAQIGRLSLSVFPVTAIRVDDFSLSNPTGFPSGDFVKAKKIYAVVDAMALLHRQVQITSLELDDLTLNMLEDPKGTWNFENPPAAKAPPQPSPSSGSGGGSFTLGVISKLTVSNGQVTAASLLPSGAPGPSLVEVHGASISLHQVNLEAFTTASLRHPADHPNVFAKLAAWANPQVYAADAQGPEVAQGTVKADTLHFGTVDVSKLNSKIRLYPKQVFVDDLDVKCYDGSVKGNLSLNFAGANLSYSVDATLKGVNMEKLLAAFPQAKGMMTGTLEGTAKLSGAVTNSSDPLVGITGSGQASISNGRLPSLQLGENLRTLAKLASVGPANGDPSSFSSISTNFHIGDARLTNDKISVVGNGVDVDGSGSMTMAGDGTLDYQGNASLAAGQNNPLAAIVGGLAGGKFENGKMTFPFAVAGTFAKPKFSLKGAGSGVAGAPAAAAEQPVNAVKDIVGMFKKKKSQ